MENKKKREIKKAKTIFGVAFGASLAVFFALAALGHYLVGIAIGFVGCLGAGMYTKSVEAKYRLGDERSKLIDGNARALAFKVTFPTIGVLFAILMGLWEEYGIEIPAYAILGPIFALMGVAYGVASHHYAKKYT
jgi:hypothetical protein